MRRLKKRGLETKKSLYAYIFLIPWILGVLQFFIAPMFKTLQFSLSTVDISDGGFVCDFVGLENYKYAFFSDPNYVDFLLKSIGEYLYSMPIIVFISLVIAIMLNGEFKGRIFFRALYFLPVIVATGVVMKFFNGEQNAVMYQTSSLTGGDYTVNELDLNVVLQQLNLPAKVTELMSTYIATIFNLIWSCGIPITLFISGLQTIPPQLYEASKVEGANKWEEFWFLTIPMLSNVLILVIIFVSLDLFTAESNSVINQAYDFMRSQAIYDTSAAMLWLYFAIASLLTGGILFAYNKLCVKRWQ